MGSVEVKIMRAFVDNGAGGNPAGVVFDAQRFDTAAKQRIAARVGLSETAFVSPSRTAAFKLDFFTPTRQIAHCGHATIATFCYLAQTGQIHGTRSSKETIEGNRNIIIAGDMAFMEQSAPRYLALDPVRDGVSREDVYSSLGLATSDALAACLPQVVNTANNFLIVPLRDAAALARIRPDVPAIERISQVLNLIGYYVFCTAPQVAGRDAGVRMFAPYYGIPEESATGTGAGPLACYLYDVLGIRKSRLVIEQGRLMTPPSPSELTVDLSLQDGKITGLLVGGRAMVSKTIEVESE